MYLAKQLTARSLPEIGRKFGGRDHTTVMHAVRKIDELRRPTMASPRTSSCCAACWRPDRSGDACALIAGPPRARRPPRLPHARVACAARAAIRARFRNLFRPGLGRRA